MPRIRDEVLSLASNLQRADSSDSEDEEMTDTSGYESDEEEDDDQEEDDEEEDDEEEEYDDEVDIFNIDQNMEIDDAADDGSQPDNHAADDTINAGGSGSESANDSEDDGYESVLVLSDDLADDAGLNDDDPTDQEADFRADNVSETPLAPPLTFGNWTMSAAPSRSTSETIENTFVEHEMTPFEQAYGFWLNNFNISRACGKALLDVLRLMPNVEALNNLPTDVATAKLHSVSSLPVLEQRRAKIQLKSDQLPSLNPQEKTKQPKLNKSVTG